MCNPHGHPLGTVWDSCVSFQIRTQAVTGPGTLTTLLGDSHTWQFYPRPSPGMPPFWADSLGPSTTGLGLDSQRRANAQISVQRLEHVNDDRKRNVRSFFGHSQVIRKERPSEPCSPRSSHLESAPRRAGRPRASERRPLEDSLGL